MKNMLFAVLQFLLFFAVFGIFSLSLHPHIQSVIRMTDEGPRVFVWDGLLLSFALSVLIMVIEAVRGRIQKAGPWTSGAFICSTLAGLALKFGFLTR